ncbi:LLM class flavin-dependent oxidoreductase [Streptomyces sp. SID14478]|uniref:LLM class flavin-dependent oxidoreductase n=1 Tax=Streptomyces sp. SID14478 TaxID=2706073 RepID=UPI0013DC8F42|nr:LLM class flavin-dependent oxidoreductase [Streptomyces sp. SID14478]NEB74193.1 LLM class flavin-dependent oxidoreductase [Streptomyces sp. SID14478]
MPQNHPLLHWFLPVAEGRDDTGRPVRIARAAEQAGFASLFTPVGRGRFDPWQRASVLAGHTERIGFLVGVRAGAVSPTVLAGQADAFRRFTGGRLRLNLVTGGEDGELPGESVHLAHDQRYGRTDEVAAVLRALLDGRRVDFQGQHVQVEGARLAAPAVEHDVPLYIGGTSGAAENLAARRADVHLLRGEEGEPPSALAARVARLRDRNPSLRFALRLHLGERCRPARQICDYAQSGIDEFVLSGRPDPDEILRVGEEVREETQRRRLPVGPGETAPL